MSEPCAASPEQATEPAGIRCPWQLLNCLLFCALIGALLGAKQGAEAFAIQGGRWSLGALLLGIHMAFAGARIGAIAGTSWLVTRRRNIVLGVGAGVLAGVAVYLLARALYPPLAFLVLRSPEPVLPAMQRAMQEALPGIQETASQAALTATIVSCVAYLTRRIGACPRRDDPATEEEQQLQVSEK